MAKKWSLSLSPCCQKVCKYEYGYNDTVCDNLQDYEDEQIEVNCVLYCCNFQNFNSVSWKLKLLFHLCLLHELRMKVYLSTTCSYS